MGSAAAVHCCGSLTCTVFKKGAWVLPTPPIILASIFGRAGGREAGCHRDRVSGRAAPRVLSVKAHLIARRMEAAGGARRRTAPSQ